MLFPYQSYLLLAEGYICLFKSIDWQMAFVPFKIITRLEIIDLDKKKRENIEGKSKFKQMSLCLVYLFIIKSSLMCLSSDR